MEPNYFNAERVGFYSKVSKNGEGKLLWHTVYSVDPERIDEFKALAKSHKWVISKDETDKETGQPTGRHLVWYTTQKSTQHTDTTYVQIFINKGGNISVEQARTERLKRQRENALREEMFSDMGVDVKALAMAMMGVSTPQQAPVQQQSSLAQTKAPAPKRVVVEDEVTEETEIM